MSEPKSANSDPSMDDILKSIRKIISDDEARAQVTGQLVTSQQVTDQMPTAPEVTSQQAARPGMRPPAPTRPASPVAGHDDVLLLTDMIDSSAPEAANPIPIRLPRKDPARAASMPQPTLVPTTKPAPSTLASTPSTAPALVSSVASESTALALARLNQVVQDSAPPPAALDPGPTIDSNGRTVEDLVKEMLRPMLQEWLDRNLPPLVERYVEREIVRLTRR